MSFSLDAKNTKLNYRLSEKNIQRIFGTILYKALRREYFFPETQANEWAQESKIPREYEMLGNFENFHPKTVRSSLAIAQIYLHFDSRLHARLEFHDLVYQRK